MTATVLITGGTGLIGNRLVRLLAERGYRVIILTRDKKRVTQSSNAEPALVWWDPTKKIIPVVAVQEADYIINLAGENIAAKRWTSKQKKAIAESRINIGQLLVKTLQEHSNKVKAVINASAKDWYGDDSQLKTPFTTYTEDMEAAPGFMGATCKAWEESVAPLSRLGKRVVWLRTGLVLTPRGGVLQALMRPAKFGIATILGSGRQMQSWIHIDDICRMYIHAIENETLHGAYNAVAPLPVDHKTLVTALAKKLKGPFFISVYVPAFILKWIFGEISTELFKSNTLSADKIRKTGFIFLFPSLDAALNQLLKT